MEAFSFEEIRRRVKQAIDKFFENEGELLYIDANERSITHKLADYLQNEFPPYKVDCEYNRRGTEVKRLLMDGISCRPEDHEAVTVYPDIIIHHRGVQNNLLVIEVKKSSSERDNSIDLKKLSKFTSDPEYLYHFGLFLSLDVEREKIMEEIWFKDGNRIE